MPAFDARIAEPLTDDQPPVTIAYDTALWDSGVIVRYAPERPVRNPSLSLGAGARLRSGTVVYAGSAIGRALDTGHNVVIREENVLGDDVRISANTVVDHGCRIGSNVRIGSGCYIGPNTILADDVVVGDGCIFAGEPGEEVAPSREGTVVGRGARIGVNTSILAGVVIEGSAVIPAGSVVKRDVAAGQTSGVRIAPDAARLPGMVTEDGTARSSSEITVPGPAELRLEP